MKRSRLILRVANSQVHPSPSSETYSEATVLACSLPDFPAITAYCSPKDVIDMLANLKTRFDRLIEMHKVCATVIYSHYHLNHNLSKLQMRTAYTFALKYRLVGFIYARLQNLRSFSCTSSTPPLTHFWWWAGSTTHPPITPTTTIPITSITAKHPPVLISPLAWLRKQDRSWWTTFDCRWGFATFHFFYLLWFFPMQSVSVVRRHRSWRGQCHSYRRKKTKVSLLKHFQGRNSLNFPILV